jgi:hypothetical protein
VSALNAKRIFDYLPFFVVALFAVTVCFPKVFIQDSQRFNLAVSNKQAIEQIKPALLKSSANL